MRINHINTKIPGYLKLHVMQHKVLMFATIASLLLHALLISEFSFTLPELDNDDPQTLDMRLVQPQPAPNKPADIEQKTATPIKPKPKSTKQETPSPPAAPSPQPAAESAAVTDSTVNTAPTNAEQISTEDSSTDIDNELHNTAQSKLPEEARQPAYRHVETEFEVSRGINTTAVGITKIVFNIDNTGKYSINSQTQAKGLASLFFGNLVQKSEGSVTENGLKPDFYSYQYGNDTKKLQSANFAWGDSLLHLHNAKGDSTIALAAGTQDFLSFMYQFMYVPPLDSMQITMTNGKKLRTYHYSFEGEEVLSTKLGELNTMHIVKSSGEDEKTEIWLATDYQNLPVKIRKTEKNDSIIEQTVSNISAN